MRFSRPERVSGPKWLNQHPADYQVLAQAVELDRSAPHE
jgi:hypothetical protein